jgi:O-antigen ligase/uncharacterized membrane protein YbhN (UPF0104 family)
MRGIVSRTSQRRLAIGILSLLYCGLLLLFIDLKVLGTLISKLSWVTIALTLLIAIFANLCVFLRSRAVLHALGFSTKWSSLFLAFSVGNIASLPLNVVGQGLTRAMILARAGVPFAVTVLATYIERILAAGLLFFLSLIGLWILFGNVAIDLSAGAGQVIRALFGMVAVFGVVGLTQYREQLLRYGLIVLRWLPKLWTGGLLTIIAHGAGLAAYLILLSDLAPRPISAPLVAALIVVMFVASLPISFAGFGLRELSAASTLTLVGLSAEAAVAAALAIGIIHLVVTGLFAAVVLALIGRYDKSPDEAAGNETTPLAASLHDWDGMIVHACAVGCAVLMFFRLRTQLEGSVIPVNVNLADIVISVALSIIILMLAVRRLKFLFPPLLSGMLAVLTGLIAIGLFTSFLRDNLGNWALYARGLGWLLMLGYAALGAATYLVAGDRGRMLVLRSMVVAAITICILQLAMLALSLVAPIPGFAIPYPLPGFANNRNAFSFELAMISCLLIVARIIGMFEGAPKLYAWAIGIITVTIYFTASRTGAVFVLLLAILDLILQQKTRSDAKPTSAVSWLAAAALMAAIVLTEYVTGAWYAHAAANAPPTSRIFHPQGDAHRLDTITGGLELWKDSPLFGAGIGAYVEMLQRAGETTLGIHSTYVWFLAEMGVVGLVGFLGCGLVLAHNAWGAIERPTTQAWGLTTIAIVAFMAVGGIAQDFFYQRIFWFLLGLVAAGAHMRKSEASDRLFLATVVSFGIFVFCLSMMR